MLQKISLAIAVLLMVVPLACGGGQAPAAQGKTAGAETISKARKQAAELAAQTQLRNAETGEEEYFGRHQAFAPSAAALRAEFPHLSPRLKVVKGSATGFEISIQADDPSKTAYIIRKTGDLIERVDSNGQPW